MHTPSVVRALAVLLVAASPVAAQKVWVVDEANGPGTDATSIVSVLSQTAPVDIVLVRTGNYFNFVLKKGISIVRDAGATVHIHAPDAPAIEVRDVPAGQSVLLFGLDCAGPSLEPGIDVHDNAGSVVLDQCSGEGGWPMVNVGDSAAVTLVDCSFTGAPSTEVFYPVYSLAGPALTVTGSTVVVQGGALRGGDGNDGQANGLNDNVAAHPGAAALKVVSGAVFAGGCTLTGGDGGDADCSMVTMAFIGAEPGGPGLSLTSGSPTVTTNDVTLVPGVTGAPTALCPDPPPDAPPSQVQTGTFTELVGAASGLAVTSPVREAQTASATVTGVPGSAALLLLSPTPAAIPIKGLSGALTVGVPPVLIALGALPAGGSLTIQGLVPDLGPAVEGVAVFLQAGTFDAGVGHGVLGESASLVVLDSSL